MCPGAQNNEVNLEWSLKSHMKHFLSQYYRCPEEYCNFALKGPLSDSKGYFRFGDDAICYGKYHGAPPSNSYADGLRDALSDTVTANGTTYLPFDPNEVLDNLHLELYSEDQRRPGAKSVWARLYYAMRPVLPFALRTYLKRFHLRDWQDLSFPRWPVDCSVDALLEHLLLLSVRASAARRIPFIWFWPEGASSCAIMTHDVETEAGLRFSATLMDIDDAFGIKSSFQIVPESRYDVSPEFLASLRSRGFEVVIHDLNHDGKLYSDQQVFMQRVAKINDYGKQYGTDGFRSAVLYRNQQWYGALRFSYDMSVPNVAHLDPQRGGCCTVMPFVIGDMVELPVTTTQDYMLFHILNDYSTDLWKRQIDLIMEKHGLISFIVHPDYVQEGRERAVYEALLSHVASLRQERGVWTPTPGEVNRWWRQRARMQLVEDARGLRIEGDGSERARIAYATEKDGQLIVTIQPAGSDCSRSTVHAH